MKIVSARFIKGIVGDDKILNDGTSQIAFIGRSNAGKSSVINSLTNQKNLAKTSSSPGRTQEINIFFINESLYLVDLPGYGFAKASLEKREQLQKLIFWYLFKSQYEQKKIVLIIDANVGLTDLDMEMLYHLEIRNKSIIIVANKIDKIKKSEYQKQFQKIQNKAGNLMIIPFSAEIKTGVRELTREILKQ